MICENCNKEHDGSYASGRFCSSKCARGYSTKLCRDRINLQVSEKLTGRPKHPNVGWHRVSKEAKSKGGINSAKAKKKRNYEKNKMYYETGQFNKLVNINKDLKPYYKEKILEEQNNKCNTCKNNTWNNLPLVLEIHHKDGNKYNYLRENVECLCPNCHSQTDTWKTRGGINKYKK